MFVQLFDVPAAERRQASADIRIAWPERRHDHSDPLAQMAEANAADASLLRLVICAAGATLLLALATSLV